LCKPRSDLEQPLTHSIMIDLDRIGHKLLVDIALAASALALIPRE
jgi:hypothetical protein